MKFNPMEMNSDFSSVVYHSPRGKSKDALLGFTSGVNVNVLYIYQSTTRYIFSDDENKAFIQGITKNSAFYSDSFVFLFSNLHFSFLIFKEIFLIAF